MEPQKIFHHMVLNLPEILDIPSAAFSAINWVFCVLSDSMTSFKAFSRCRNLSFSVCNIVFSSIMSFTVSTPSASNVRFPYKYQNIDITTIICISKFNIQVPVKSINYKIFEYIA